MPGQLGARVRSLWGHRTPSETPVLTGENVYNSAGDNVPRSTNGAGEKGDFDGELVVEQPYQPGELSLEEATNGGMGRHLGVFSTTLLM